MKKALIVDDHEQNRYLLQTILKNQGYDVMMAANGVEALQQARTDPPDIIISDILMPGMNGFTLCREWKKDERLQLIPFVFYTATYTDPRDEELALSLGAARFVVKPLDPAAFVALLRQVIKERETGRLPAPVQTATDQMDFYKLYSEVLVRKLEDKMLQLEKRNRELEQENTARRRMEEALKESEKRYRLLAENAQDVIFVLDLNLNYTYVSPSIKILRGCAPEEVLGKSSMETLTPASWDLAVKTISETMELEKAGPVDLYRFRTMELEMKRKDGTTVWTEVKVSFIRDEDDRPTGILGVTRDITERKQANETLRLSEQKFTAAFQSSPTAITITSAKDGLIVEANDTLLRITGYEHGEVVGHTFAELRLWVDNAARDRYMALLREQGHVVEMEVDFRIKSGDVRSCLVTGALMEIGGRPHILGTTLDVTERKQAEEALRESEKKYRHLFESILDVFYRTDNEGTLLIVSPSVEKLLGYLPDEVVGKKLSGFYINPEERDIFLSLLREKGSAQEFETPLRTKDGSVVIVSTNAQLYRNNQGNILGVQGISRDVTRRKQAEEQVQHILDSLRKAINTTIQVMVSAVEIRDPYTAGHQIRSAALARAIAAELGLPQEKIEGIHMVGTIHDIGKLSIPAEILSKPTKLTEIEFSLIKEHARRGFEMLKDVESPWPLAEIVYQHHERMDGSGYPRNLKGEDILIEARILTIADVVEAMSSHRPYRPGLGIGAALEEIEKNKGILYDADAVDVCLKLFREKRYELTQ